MKELIPCPFCGKESYIDGDGEFHLEWIPAQAAPCVCFREVRQ